MEKITNYIGSNMKILQIPSLKDTLVFLKNPSGRFKGHKKGGNYKVKPEIVKGAIIEILFENLSKDEAYGLEIFTDQKEILAGIFLQEEEAGNLHKKKLLGNISRWHNDNCKKNPKTESLPQMDMHQDGNASLLPFLDETQENHTKPVL